MILKKPVNLIEPIRFQYVSQLFAADYRGPIKAERRGKAENLFLEDRLC